MSDASGNAGEALLLAPPGSDAELVARICTKDDDAFDELYRRHVHTVYRAALARAHATHDAEEITQETFVTLWRRAASVRLADSALPWLLATARYVALNRLRADATRTAKLVDAELALQPDTAPSPEDRHEQNLLAAAIAAAVAALNEADQRLYRLCIEDGLSYTDAAAELGLSSGSVRNRLSRLRRRLRSSLKDYGKGGSA